jgi:hypothetical protein
MADGASRILTLIPTSREVAKLASLRQAPVADHPMANAYGHAPVQPLEPEPTLEVDRRAGCVLWVETGLRLREPDDFRQLANLFLTNGKARAFNALNDAEMALSEVGGAAIALAEGRP